MKLFTFTSLLALSNAFILPDEEVFSELAVESSRKVASGWDKVPKAKDLLRKISHQAEDAFDRTVDKAENIIDRILDASSEAQTYITDQAHQSAFDVQGWLASEDDEPCEASFDEPDHHHRQPPGRGPPGRGPPGKRPPRRGRPGHGRPPHRRPPHHGPPHGRHPHKSNLTVYQMIANSKYTTKLAKLISEYDDLVDLLNGTSSNFTIFAPTDAAFRRIPDHAHKPSKEFLKKLLTYHVSPEFYPARRVIAHDTVPTALDESALNGPQRLSVQLGFKGLTVNFYSRIIAPNIFATNGVIHGIDHILLPPPPIGAILNFLPQEFSTLLLAFDKTGLGEELNGTAHVGSTIFAPGNRQFAQLGVPANAFLFSPRGLKYLKALLQYHIVVNTTLYSDAGYYPDSSDGAEAVGDGGDDAHAARRPRRAVHVDLPTLLDGRSLPVDIVRYGPVLSMRVNGIVRVAVKNGIAKDGVLHVPSSVLIPPKTRPGAAGVGDVGDVWQGGEISVEELKERLEPLVAEEGASDDVEDGSALKWEM